MIATASPLLARSFTFVPSDSFASVTSFLLQDSWGRKGIEEACGRSPVVINHHGEYGAE